MAGHIVACHGAGNGLSHYEIEQGVEMGRPSRIDLSLEVVNGSLARVLFGGAAVEFRVVRYRFRPTNFQHRGLCPEKLPKSPCSLDRVAPTAPHFILFARRTSPAAIGGTSAVRSPWPDR